VKISSSNPSPSPTFSIALPSQPPSQNLNLNSKPHAPPTAHLLLGPSVSVCGKFFVFWSSPRLIHHNRAPPNSQVKPRKSQNLNLTKGRGYREPVPVRPSRTNIVRRSGPPPPTAVSLRNPSPSPSPTFSVALPSQPHLKISTSTKTARTSGRPPPSGPICVRLWPILCFSVASSSLLNRLASHSPRNKKPGTSRHRACLIVQSSANRPSQPAKPSGQPANQPTAL